MSEHRARTLQDVLREKAGADASIDWPKQRDEYLKAVEDLYKRIGDWLTPSREEGLVTLTLENTDLVESYIGRYDVQRLLLSIGAATVRFEPKGRNIVGAKGRVDASCAGHLQLFVLGDGGEWLLADRTPRLVTRPLTEESFREVMERLLS